MTAPVRQPLDTSAGDDTEIRAHTDAAAASPFAGSVMLHPPAYGTGPDAGTGQYFPRGSVVAPAADPEREFLVVSGYDFDAVVDCFGRAPDGIGFSGTKCYFRRTELLLVAAAPPPVGPIASAMDALISQTFDPRPAGDPCRGGCTCRHAESAGQSGDAQEDQGSAGGAWATERADLARADLVRAAVEAERELERMERALAMQSPAAAYSDEQE